MKNYKEMNWDELEDCVEKIREEIDRFEQDAEMWESRNVDGMPTPDFYSRIEELKEELATIQQYQEALED